MRAPQDHRRLHELPLAERQDLAPDDPGVDDPARHPDDRDDVPEARPQDADHGDGQQDERERELDVGESHERVVDPPAEVARREADGQPEAPGDRHGRQADDQGDPGAEEGPREDVPPEVIRAEPVDLPAPVSPSGRLEPLRDVLFQGIEGGEEGGEEGRGRHRGDHDQPEERRPSSREPARERPRLALPPGGGSRQAQDADGLVHRTRIRGSRYV